MPTLAELSRIAGAELAGPADLVLEGIASLEGAGPGDLAPLAEERFLQAAADSKAGAFLLPAALRERIDRPCLLSDFPLAALNRVAEAFGLVRPRPGPGVHPAAVVAEGATLGPDCSIGPCAVIESGARLGARCVVHAHVVVEADVVVGDECRLEPGCVLHDGTRLGDRVQVGARAVLSRQGFGFAPGPGGIEQLHHVGRVVIGDDARIGGGCTIDRARFDETRIGRGSALDNLVHVGHNCTIGDHTFVAAQTGMAGNSHFGSGCEIGGQVGVGNRARLGDRCRVGAQSGVAGEWPDGSELFGSPAVSRRDAIRQIKTLERLVRDRRVERRRRER